MGLELTPRPDSNSRRREASACTRACLSPAWGRRPPLQDDGEDSSDDDGDPTTDGEVMDVEQVLWEHHDLVAQVRSPSNLPQSLSISL